MRIPGGALGLLTRSGCCAALLFMLATLPALQARSQDQAAEDQAASAARNAARRAAQNGRRIARSAQSNHQNVRAAFLQDEGSSVLTETVPPPQAATQTIPEYQENWAPGAPPAVQGYDGGGADGWSGSCGGSCDLGGDSCGSDCGSCGGCGPCPCGPPGRFWVRGDYLLWWTKGLSTPELVTTSPYGVPREEAGVLGNHYTHVLFGAEDLLKDSRSGGRIKAGIWLDCCNKYGLEADYFALGDATDDFRAVSFGGDPILARPFFNVLTGREDSELVGLPGTLEGAVGVEVESSFSSAGVRWRHNLCCSELACMPDCNGATCNLCYVPKGTTRWDLLLGYRFMRLDESILITEDLNSLTGPTQFHIFDDFETETEFHGVEIGLAYEFHRCRWSLDLLAKVALGNNHQSVQIDGGTEIVTAGIPNRFNGGLLAQRTNSGEFERDKFGAIPEIGVTLGYRLTDQLKLTMGYTFIYWSKVVRPGEQIDRAVNPNLLPPEAVPLVGPLRPAFAFNESDFWAQGLNFGGELRW